MIVTIVGKISWLYLHITYSNNTFYFLLPDIILPNPLRPPPTTLPRFDTAPPAAFVKLPAVEFAAFVKLPAVEFAAFVKLPAVEFARLCHITCRITSCCKWRC